MPNQKHIIVVGQRFSRLVTIEYCKPPYRWKCLCDCGNTTTASSYELVSEHSRSCGCIQRDQLISRNTKHGLSHTPEYQVWLGIISRTEDRNDKSFSYYGGRKIFMCAEWRGSFVAFYEHIGPRPSPNHSIDRIDNERGYEPGNVRWATKEEQMGNMRSNHWITYENQTKTISQWERDKGFTPGVLKHRIYNWNDIHKAFTTPIRKQKPRN